MKRLILLGLLSISIFSCTDETFNNSLNGSWTVYSFEDLTTGSTEFKTEENSWNMDINVKFDESKNPKTISGKNITNQIFGEFNYTRKNQFRVNDYFESTKVNQPRWADEFVVAILDQNLSYKITGNTLVISYNNNTKSVTLKRN